MSSRVIGFAIEVHRELGPGLLESAYEEALAYEFASAGLTYERQREILIRYKGINLNCGYRIDFLVEGTLILEMKALTEILPVHRAQLITYFKLQNLPVGLLINWKVPVLKDGIARIVQGPLFNEDRPF